MSFVNFLCILLVFGAVTVGAAPSGTSKDSAPEAPPHSTTVTKPAPTHSSTVTTPAPTHSTTVTTPAPTHSTTVTKPAPTHSTTVTKPAPSNSKDDPTTASPLPKCAPKFSLHGDYCYSFTVQRSISFDDALIACEEQNATLTSVRSDGEHNFIVDMVQQPEIIGATFFIGALFNENIGKWTWIDHKDVFGYWPPMALPPGMEPDMSIKKNWMAYDTSYGDSHHPLLYSFPSTAGGYICKYKLGDH
uniref:C-type lectin domain-containing protein n=1 Tax=Panagrellus redivivus TaxID=6233 RepID=A0A7E4VYZ3_PANRE